MHISPPLLCARVNEQYMNNNMGPAFCPEEGFHVFPCTCHSPLYWLVGSVNIKGFELCVLCFGE